MLAQRLRDEARLSLDLLRRFGEELIQTTDYLEQQGVAHRDIKPENIGMSQVGTKGKLQLVLFDFSLSRASPDNIAAGTHPYLDPFLSLRRPPRWDLYAERFALATTLYEMVSGDLPRWGDGKTAPAMLDCEATLDIERFDPRLRDGLTAFFEKGLRWSPRALPATSTKQFHRKRSTASLPAIAPATPPSCWLSFAVTSKATFHLKRSKLVSAVTTRYRRPPPRRIMHSLIRAVAPAIHLRWPSPTATASAPLSTALERRSRRSTTSGRVELRA